MAFIEFWLVFEVSHSWPFVNLNGTLAIVVANSEDPFGFKVELHKAFRWVIQLVSADFLTRVQQPRTFASKLRQR